MQAALARTPRAAARRDTIAKMLCDWLGATTTYPIETKNWQPPPIKPTTMYGWQLEFVPDGILDADGKATGFKIERKFTHQPGEVVEARGGQRYMVRTDHSLRRISEKLHC